MSGWQVWDMRERDFISAVPQKTIRKGRLFCSSHGGSSTALLSRVLNIPFPHLCIALGHIPHTCITSLRFDRTPGSLGMPIIEYAVDDKHLRIMGEDMVTGPVEKAQ